MLLNLRGDGAMAAAVGEEPPRAPATDKEPRQEPAAEPRRVHEVTESSSDEGSADERSPMGASASANTSARARASERNVIPTSPRPRLRLGDKKRAREDEGWRGGDDDVYAEEFYPTRNVADMVYLFTNDQLKEKPATVVLRNDPFCIPRVTDNVQEYRPRFNPLSILEAEEQLLPGYFRLDPTEGVPGASDLDAHARKRPQPEPSFGGVRRPTGTFIGKSTAFMGTMPRQQEFTEFPISENIFHSFKAGPTPAAPASQAHGLFASKLYHGGSFSSGAASNATLGDFLDDSPVQTTSTAEGTLESPAALEDAVLLSSMHHSGDAPPSEPMTATEPQLHPHGVANTLTNYFPSSQPVASAPVVTSTLPGDRFLDDIAGGHSIFVSQPLADTSSALPSLIVEDVDSSSNIMNTVMITATTPHHDDTKERSSLQPVAKKPRAKNVFRQCTAPGCSKGARGKSGLCQRHGGGRRCAAPDCPKGAQGSSNMCLFHGGGYRCTVDGCSTGARGTSGLCAKHGGYKKTKEEEAESKSKAKQAKK